MPVFSVLSLHRGMTIWNTLLVRETLSSPPTGCPDVRVEGGFKLTKPHHFPPIQLDFKVVWSGELKTKWRQASSISLRCQLAIYFWKRLSLFPICNQIPVWFRNTKHIVISQGMKSWIYRWHIFVEYIWFDRSCALYLATVLVCEERSLD